MTTVMIPAPVGEILKTLEAAGYGAWCVGGCVRDALLGREPHDYDAAVQDGSFPAVAESYKDIDPELMEEVKRA